MNVVCLSGRLTSDPILKYGRNDTAIGIFSIANHDTKSDSLYIDNIKVFGEDALNLQKFFCKGREISFSGHFEKGKNGVEIIADTIYFGPKPKEKIKQEISVTDDEF